jgi:hypothetical protein
MLKEQKTNIVVLGLMAILSVLLVTPTAKADLDIDWICITSFKSYIDGIPKAKSWEFDIWAYVIDKGTLHHIDITKPGASTPFATAYEDINPPDWWTYYSPTDYSSLNDLRVDYPEGVYTFEFRDSDGTVIRTVSLDYTGLPSEPTNPVDFTYPAIDGATGIPTNPTFTWNVNSSDGDTLFIALDDAAADINIYWDIPVSTTTTSWAPSALLASHDYALFVSTCNVKNWGGGSQFPTMTVDSDVFEYSLMFEYLNEINFTTGSAPQEPPDVMLAETALFIMEEVESGNIAPELEGSLLVKINAALAALDRGNPNDAKVAMNDLKALNNQVEAQTNKKITPEAAAEIIQRINAIIATLGS